MVLSNTFIINQTSETAKQTGSIERGILSPWEGVLRFHGILDPMDLWPMAMVDPGL